MVLVDPKTSVYSDQERAESLLVCVMFVDNLQFLLISHSHLSLRSSRGCIQTMPGIQ